MSVSTSRPFIGTPPGKGIAAPLREFAQQVIELLWRHVLPCAGETQGGIHLSRLALESQPVITNTTDCRNPPG